MGIRFRCHLCEHELNLKEFQAGRRARCPECSGRFRVPPSSADFSLPLDDAENEMASAGTALGAAAAGSATFNLKPSTTDPDVQRAAVGNRPAGHVPNSAGNDSSIGRLPLAIAEAPQAIWYVRPPGGDQYGPADGHLFYQWMQDNRVSPDSLVWRDGWPQWILAGEAFEEFFGSAWRVAQNEPATAQVNSHALQAELFSGKAEMAADVDLGAGVAGPLTGKAQLSPPSSVALARRKKQQMTYGIVIATLAVLALMLVGVLVSVVMKS